SRPDDRCISLGVECEGGEFGRLSMEIGVPLHLQGTQQSFDVTASARYPYGKGRMLRCRDGLVVGEAGGEAFRAALTIAAAATGHIHMLNQARCKMTLPRGVS